MAPINTRDFVGLLTFRERFPLTYDLNDIFFYCLGLARHENIQIDRSEIREATFMPLNCFAETPSANSGVVYVKSILRRIGDTVESVDDLVNFVQLTHTDIDYDMTFYKGDPKGKLHLPLTYLKNNIDK